MDGEIMSKIILTNINFSKSQKRIADFIDSQYDKAAFMTAARLGKFVGVSESTVVRFAVQAGYEGYPEMQKALQEMIRNKLTAVQRIEIASDRIGDQDLLESVLSDDANKIKTTLEELDKDVFAQSVEAILAAKTIYILGVRSSAALASFLGFYFGMIFNNVRLINTSSASEMFEQLLNVGVDDVVIGISFPRYSKRTVKVMEYSHRQGAKVISLTDSKLSPLAKCSDLTLLAKIDMTSFVDSLVAPLSVINALIVAISMRDKSNIYETFEKLERIWDEYDVYEKIEGEE